MSPINALTAEKDLIEKAKVDRNAFLAIYDAHFRKIYNYAFYRTFNHLDAEEITSQTFLSALENIHRYSSRNVPIAAWLYRIASNAIVDLYRKRGQTVELKVELIDAKGSSDPEDAAIQNLEKEQLVKNIMILPPLQQQAIILCYLQNLSYKEISEILGKSEGAVKQLLHRGLTSLRERMVQNV